MATTSPTYDLDELAQQIETLVPPLDLSLLCCCHLIDPSLQPDQHLDECELPLLQCGTNQDQSHVSSPSVPSSSDSDINARRRKQHRESMARLRQGWRKSIAALGQQEKQLQQILQRMMTATPHTKPPADNNEGLNPLEVLRRSYRELVIEQARLEQEHASLEAAWAHREKYERLLQRELERVRTFNLGEK